MTMNVLECYDLWHQARAIHPDDTRRQNEAFMEALGVFAALVAADANAARIAAQTENEALKARLAASGVAERRAVHEAVLAEREACSKVCDAVVAQMPTKIVNQVDLTTMSTCLNLAAAIRARGAA